jgi:TonB-linked SusC/RagA family outer membrane protein
MKKPRPMAKAILLSLFLTVFALNASAQKVTLSFQNETFEKVLSSIKQQTRLSLVFSEQFVDLNRKVSINVKSVPVEDALKQLLIGTNLSYEIKNNKLYFVEKKAEESKETPIKSKKITGLVTDEKGEPIIGASVVLKGSNTGTVTNNDGLFSLEVQAESEIFISYIGFKQTVLKVGIANNYKIVLEEDSKALDEVVVVGYGTQKKGNLTGSVSDIKSDKLTIAPISNVSNVLAGQLPGLVAKQSTGLPGSDSPLLSIRGFGAPLLIVDGVETNFNNIDASQIESISILKDGSASIYGARAGNGVVLITTKRGVNLKPIVSLNTSYTLQGATQMARPQSSGQRAEWAREAYLNAGLPTSQVPYTPEEVQKYFDGNDPHYLNSDWFGAAIRTWAPQQNHNVSVRGGNDKIKYYGFFGYTNQETMIKNDGGNYNRYNIQSNTDAKITDRLTLSLDLAMAYEERLFPVVGYATNNFWDAFYESDPKYPVYLSDPTKLSYGGISYGSALYATSTKYSGSNDNTSKQIRSGASLTYEFKNFKGLKAKAYINYIDNIGLTHAFTKQADFYLYDVDLNQYRWVRSSQDPTSLTESSSTGYNLTQQYSLMYDNVFNKVHHLSALALYENINYKDSWFYASRSGFLSTALDQLFAGNSTTASNDGAASEMGRVSWVGRINYSYKDKYLIETIFRADASSKFPANSRWGYFPSVSLGWVISQENFMKSLDIVDNMKLRASYGQSGNDAVGNYQYLSGYSFDGSYKLGDVTLPTLYITGLANPILTWEKMNIYNLGLDFSLFNHKLYGNGDVFYRLREGIPGTRVGSLPSTFGAALPEENLNSIDTRGFEFILGTTGKSGDFSYDVSGNISWNRSKWVKFDEPVYTDPDQKRIYQLTGQWTDRQFGYVSDKLFASQDEIDALPYVYKDLSGNDKLRPGDVKYKDLNNDSILDWKDQKEIGSGSMPHWMFGINSTLKYKNFDLQTMFQGAFGYDTYIYLEGAKTSILYDNRWTDVNNNINAIVPRPGGSPTNGYFSDYRLHATAYIRLKNASLGYELPNNLLKLSGISKLRIYVAGTNIFTLSTLSKYGIDPEVPDGNAAYYYPQQRTISMGMNLTF